MFTPTVFAIGKKSNQPNVYQQMDTENSIHIKWNTIELKKNMQ